MEEGVEFQSLFVPTMMTQRFWYLNEIHIQQKKPIMFVGNAGTGKTALINQFMNTLP